MFYLVSFSISFAIVIQLYSVGNEYLNCAKRVTELEISRKLKCGVKRVVMPYILSNRYKTSCHKLKVKVSELFRNRICDFKAVVMEPN